MKSGNLNFLEASGPLQACNGTDLSYIQIYLYEDYFENVEFVWKAACLKASIHLWNFFPNRRTFFLFFIWNFYLFEYEKLLSWCQLSFKDHHNASFLGNVHQCKAYVSDYAIFCVHVHVPVWVRNNVEEIYKVNSYTQNLRLGICVKNFVVYILIYIKRINILLTSYVSSRD